MKPLLLSLLLLCGCHKETAKAVTHAGTPEDHAPVAPQKEYTDCSDPNFPGVRTCGGSGAIIPGGVTFTQQNPITILDTRPPLQVALAEEIARQEGFYVKGSLPARLHNPGALVFAGQKEAIRDCGTPDLICGQYAYFPTDEAGWAALHKDIAAKWKYQEDMLREHQDWWNQYEISSHGPAKAQDYVIAEGIARNWTSPPSPAYADAIITRLRARGLLR